MSQFAIVIGIEHYPGLKANVKNACDDATAFKDWLVNVAGLPNPENEPEDAQHIELILSEEANQKGTPIKDEIDDAFGRIFDFAEKEEGPHRLYVYFTGHGSAINNAHVALLMANAQLKSLNRSLNAQEYHEKLALKPLFPEQIMFYDCCRNYDTRYTGGIPEWSDLNEQQVKAISSAIDEVRQCVFFAAGFTQYANRHAFLPTLERGYFTEALLDGLRGAEPDEDGNVMMHTLAKYVSRRLKALLRPRKLKQRLNWVLTGPAEDMVLVGGFDKRMTRVTVRVPPGSQILAVFDQKWEKEFLSVALTGPEAEIDLYPGTYNFEVTPKPQGSRGYEADHIPAAPAYSLVFRGA